MKSVLSLVSVCVLFVVVIPPVLADWPHDVKWDQLEPYSDWFWRSFVNDQENYIVADDFLCEETGWITDIESYGFCDEIESLDSFRITFWTDIPQNPDEEARPGLLLFEVLVPKASPYDPLGLGWQQIGENRFKINLPQEDWFFQEAGTVYWIGIQGVMSSPEVWFYWQFLSPMEGLSLLSDATFTDAEPHA